MLLLAIETSCDETSAAVVEDGRIVRSNVVSSQVKLHAPFGGVVPEIASRRHVQIISEVAAQALKDAGISKRQLDAIAATRGPGLAGALLVGVSFARGLALGLGLPFIPVNHLEGHLHSVFLRTSTESSPVPSMPMLALIVSGGHTELVLMRDHGDYEGVGHTLDDAAGEAFDKVARLLGLPYPGGPAIQHTADGAQDPIQLPQALLPGTFDFSFSGLKTAVLHTVHSMATGDKVSVRGVRLPKLDVATGLAQRDIQNIAAGFQESVVRILTSKTHTAAGALNARSVAVVGGVAANAALRKRMSEVIRQPLFVSPPQFATDNAAMIASAAYFVPRTREDADIEPGLMLGVRSTVKK